MQKLIHHFVKKTQYLYPQTHTQLMQIVQMDHQIFESRYGRKSSNTDNTTYIFTLTYNAILKCYNNILKGSVTGIVISRTNFATQDFNKNKQYLKTTFWQKVWLD